MMNIYRSFIILICLTFTAIAHSQEEPEDLASHFFENFEEKGYTYALENLYGSNKWILENKNAFEEVEEGLTSLTESFVGKYMGYELITKKQMSESLVLLSYIVKYERQPLRYIFIFYKPGEKWLTYGFKYDDKLTAELEEASRAYFLNLDSKYRY